MTIDACNLHFKFSSVDSKMSKQDIYSYTPVKTTGSLKPPPDKGSSRPGLSKNTLDSFVNFEAATYAAKGNFPPPDVELGRTFFVPLGRDICPATMPLR